MKKRGWSSSEEAGAFRGRFFFFLSWKLGRCLGWGVGRVGRERVRARRWAGGRAGGAAAGPGVGDSAPLGLRFCPSRRGSWKTSDEYGSPPLCSLPPRAGGRRRAGEGAGRTPAIGRGRTWGARRRRPPAVGNSCFSPGAALGRGARALEPTLG